MSSSSQKENEQVKNEMFETGLFSDFTIICTGKDGNEVERFRVHRAILATHSTYFKNMFTAEGLQEAQTREMRIQSFEVDTIRSFLAFIYLGEQPKADLSLDQLGELLHITDMYQVEELKTICEHNLTKMLAVDNAIDVLSFAELFRAEILKAAAIKFLNANKSAIVANDQGRWNEFLGAPSKLFLELYFTD